jgi:CBS domain containing-hemolysin-like protein
LIGLAATTLFSTVSYAIRMMSRVELERSLVKLGRQSKLDDILRLRHEIALSSSTLRLLANALIVAASALYFQLRYSSAEGQAPHTFLIFSCALLVAAPAMLICSVAIPSAWAKYSGEALIALLWPAIYGMHRVLYPLVAVMKVFDELVRRLAGVSLVEDPRGDAEQVEQEILAVVSEGTAEGKVDEEQKKMIEGIISFRDLEVGDIMTPRTDITALDVVTTTLGEIRERAIKDGLSRVPVYETSLDNIIGILYVKDLLTLLGDAGPTEDGGTAGVVIPRHFDLRKLMRPPLFVPRTKPLRDLLREFRAQHVHMAIVLDEYGGTSGLVTTEDIIEQIVGDIADEYEKPVLPELKHVDERTVEVDARMNVSELNSALKLNLPEDQDYQTLGGFVISTLGAIPGKGERFSHEGVEITVLDSEPRRVKLLRLELPSADRVAVDDKADVSAA